MHLFGKVAVAAALLSLTSLTAPPATSATTLVTTATLTASASVAQACSIDTSLPTAFAFAAYDPIVANKTATDHQTINVGAFCTLGWNVIINIPASLNLAGGRTGNTFLLPVAFSTTSSLTQATLGATASNQIALTGTIAGGLNPPYDTYTGSTQVTFNF